MKIDEIPTTQSHPGVPLPEDAPTPQIPQPITIGETEYGSKAVAEMQRRLDLEAPDQRGSASRSQIQETITRLSGLFPDDEEYDGSLDLFRCIDKKPPLISLPPDESPEIWPDSQMDRFIRHVWTGEPRPSEAELHPRSRSHASTPQKPTWVKQKRALLMELVADPTDRFTDAEKLRAIELDAYLDGHQPNKFHPAVLHFQVGVFLKECGMEGAAAE